MRYKVALFILGGIAVLSVLIFLFSPKNTEIASENQYKLVEGYKTIPLYVGKEKFIAEIADTEALRERGLSGRTSFGTRQGMLFVFPKLGFYPFWMKDMNFSIDMLWLDEDGVVLTIFSDISPSTYPKQFVSEQKARYVLELPANTSVDYKIKIGDVLIFDKNVLKNTSN